MFTSASKREIRHFHVVVVQRTVNKCTKERDQLAELLFWQSYPIVFFAVLVAVAVVVAQAP